MECLLSEIFRLFWKKKKQCFSYLELKKHGVYILVFESSLDKNKAPQWANICPESAINSLNHVKRRFFFLFSIDSAQVFVHWIHSH